MNAVHIKYAVIPGGLSIGTPLGKEIVKQCSELYSSHYGKWSTYAPRNAGKNVKLSPERLYDWLDDKNVALYYAKDGEQLIGYAIALQLKVPSYGIISWVTQLVVHKDYRNIEIAKNLLLSIWGFSDHYAWGIISANPYAIRALEKTTRRRSDPMRIKRNIRKILSIGSEHLPYLSEKTETFINREVSKINTEFYVDHSDVETMVRQVITEDTPWTLGYLEEGWEWIAFTFQDQKPFRLTDQEIQTMIEASDRVVHSAYRGMDLSENHNWAKHADIEADYIIRECNLAPGSTVIDFGCGQGRHSLELAKRGINVVGVDYVNENIVEANKAKEENAIEKVRFVHDDCRKVNLNLLADAVICLYDVVGTFADNAENNKILRNIANHLKPGGFAIISVMNYEVTLMEAKHTFSLKKNPDALLSLKPSRIQQTSGNIFNSEYYLVDTDEQIIYRREQFDYQQPLPREFIVRDRRFWVAEIEKMCEDASLGVVFSKCVNASNWNNSYESNDVRAKEILVKCIKKAD